MTDNVSHLILETLTGLRNEIRGFHSCMGQDMNDLKARMSSLENSMIIVKREITHGDEVDARQQVSLDRIVNRIERVEHRLELS